MLVFVEKESTNKRETKGIFKRHVMNGRGAQLGGHWIINWFHDNKSVNCIKEDVVTETVIRLSDYRKASEKRFRFDIMEFTRTNYSIRGVEIDNTTGIDSVVPQLLPIGARGSISEILGCHNITSTTKKPRTEKTKPPRAIHFNWINVLIAILVFCVSLAVIALFIMILVIYKRWQKNVRLREERRKRREARKAGANKAKVKPGSSTPSGSQVPQQKI